MLRISSARFVAGIVRGGRCAPIIAYMKGWTLKQILTYCRAKGWTVEQFP